MFYGACCASIVKLRFPSMIKMLNIPRDTAYICTPAEKQHLDIYLCCVCVMFHLSYIFSNLQIRYRCLASRMCMSKGHLRRTQTLGHVVGWPNYTICSCGDNSVFTFLRMWIAFRFARVSSNQDKMVRVPKFCDCRNWQDAVFCVVHSILVACTFSLHCLINNLCKLLGVDLV